LLLNAINNVERFHHEGTAIKIGWHYRMISHSFHTLRLAFKEASLKLPKRQAMSVVQFSGNDQAQLMANMALMSFNGSKVLENITGIVETMPGASETTFEKVCVEKHLISEKTIFSPEEISSLSIRLYRCNEDSEAIYSFVLIPKADGLLLYSGDTITVSEKHTLRASVPLFQSIDKEHISQQNKLNENYPILKPILIQAKLLAETKI